MEDTKKGLKENRFTMNSRNSGLSDLDDVFNNRINQVRYLLEREETIKLAFNCFYEALGQPKKINKVTLNKSGMVIEIDGDMYVSGTSLEESIKTNLTVFNKYKVGFGQYIHSLGKVRHIYISCNEDILQMDDMKIDERMELFETRMNHHIIPYAHMYNFKSKKK